MLRQATRAGTSKADARATEDTVRRWLRAGKLRGRKLGGDRLGYRVKESDLEAFINGVAPAER